MTNSVLNGFIVNDSSMTFSTLLCDCFYALLFFYVYAIDNSE